MLDSRIKFRHLQTFVEVARQKSVVRAADMLHVSQPAVTRTIRELEEALGVEVFEKDGRGIRISRYGEVFLRHAGAALAALRQGVNSVSLERAGSAVAVRVGALPTVSARIMPQAMRIFLADNHACRVKIVTGENAVLLEQLRLGDLDVVVGRLALPEKMTGLSFEHLYSEQVVFAVRAGHPLLSPGREVFSGLADFPVIMPARGSIIRPYVDQLLIANGVPELPSQIETVSDSFGRAFLREGDAIWIISEGVVAADIADGTLAALPVDTRETRGPVGLTLRADIIHPPAMDLLMQAIREAAGETQSGFHGR